MTSCRGLRVRWTCSYRHPVSLPRYLKYSFIKLVFNLQPFDILCIKIFIQIFSFIKVNLRSLINTIFLFHKFHHEIQIDIIIYPLNKNSYLKNVSWFHRSKSKIVSYFYSFLCKILFDIVFQNYPKWNSDTQSAMFQHFHDYLPHLSPSELVELVVLRSQLCRRWSDTKDETRQKWCRVFLRRRRTRRKMYGFHGNGTNPFSISAKMPAMLDSILVKNLGENRLSQQTPYHPVCNLYIFISLLIRGKVVWRRANFFPESGVDLWNIHRAAETNRAVRLGGRISCLTLRDQNIIDENVV